MPAVSGDYDPDVGILLQVGILPGGTVQTAQGATSARTLGLVDTGASKTSILPSSPSP